MNAEATLMTELPSLDGFLKPRGVALVGASDRSAFSRTAHAASKLIGFDEQTFLVSRSGGLAPTEPHLPTCGTWRVKSTSRCL